MNNKKLSDIPFHEIQIGLKVIGHSGGNGIVISKTKEGMTGPFNRIERFDSIEIKWNHRPHHSYVYHHQADKIHMDEV